MSMDGQTFSTLAKETLGKEWVSEITRFSGRTSRSVRNWVSGDVAVPGDIEAKLVAWSARDGWKALLLDRLRWEMERVVPRDRQWDALVALKEFVAAEEKRHEKAEVLRKHYRDRDAIQQALMDEYDWYAESALEDERWIKWCAKNGL